MVLIKIYFVKRRKREVSMHISKMYDKIYFIISEINALGRRVEEALWAHTDQTRVNIKCLWLWIHSIEKN